jgi:hypothetical protein
LLLEEQIYSTARELSTRIMPDSLINLPNEENDLRILLSIRSDRQISWATVNSSGHYCLLPHRGVHEIKRMHLASRTHGLFIT